MHRAARRCLSVLFLLAVLHTAAQKETASRNISTAKSPLNDAAGVLAKPSNETTSAKPSNETLAEPTKSEAPKDAAKKTASRKQKVEPMATTKGCPAGCEICHEDHCFSCSGGYQRINYACEKKGCSDEKCMDCSSDVCYKCVDGYAPDLDGICMWIGPTGCDEQNCKLCESTRIGCTECMAGYQLRGNKCVKKACADKNCLRCSSDGKRCEICKEGFQSRLGECLTVGCLDDQCRQCSPSGGSCYQCAVGFYAKRSEGPCKPCPDSNCVNCNGSQNSCVKCKEGYYVGRLSSGKVGCAECHKAVDHCGTCSRNGDDCFSCLPGYYLEHGHCIACPDNCDRCKSPWFCDTCGEGFDLLGSGACKAGKNATLASSNDTERQFPVITLVVAGIFHLLLGAFII